MTLSFSRGYTTSRRATDYGASTRVRALPEPPCLLSLTP
jgi:hypothetical protein